MMLPKLVVPICVSVCLLTILHTNREALLDTIPFDSHANITCNNNHTVRGAIVTILTAIDEDYINLVLVLGHSINLYDAVTCDIDRIVMIHVDAVFSRKTRALLKLAGWSLMIVPQIAPPDGVNKLTVKHERYLKCFSKILAFNRHSMKLYCSWMLTPFCVETSWNCSYNMQLACIQLECI